MKVKILTAALSAAIVLACALSALAQHAEYDALVATHAKANHVPEVLVHRVIVHESRYQPNLLGRGGTIGLMQIKLATARSLGYTGTAEGLRDPNTNLTYAVKYLAGAYRAARGDHNQAMAYYASGYYYVAKRQRLEERQASAGGKLAPMLSEKQAPVVAGKQVPVTTEEVAKETDTEPTTAPADAEQVPAK
jgi:soluble lytic murein transglycosylase-like protein